jgi:hypothetical protein
VRGVGESGADALELAEGARGGDEAPARSHSAAAGPGPGGTLL